MPPFNPTRLDVARRRRGLTKQKLAAAADVSPRILNLWEAGDREPSEQTLNGIAAALRFPVEFFLGDDVEEPLIDGVSFRSLSTMTARQRDQARGSAAIALLLDDWIRSRFDLPDPAVPRFDSSNPELVAEGVRQVWGLGERPIANMVHLLEAHGVRVFSLVQECAEVDAFSFWRDGAPYVFLNSMKTAERSRMDAAHELGHLVMHVHGQPSGRRAEDEAQAFASALLMPRRSVLATAPRGATATQIVSAKKRWNVAAMALAHRMHKLGLLTEWQARSAYIQLGRMGYRAGEPGGLERETSQVLAKVFAALKDEGVARRDVARELSIPVDELNRSIFGLTLASDGGRVRIRAADQPPSSRPPQLRVIG
jgi:Zn-dependent peptidase ImmA (M78 family)/DNA-binding XRE family transcriptional regulator